jgi:hypothetical protein
VQESIKRLLPNQLRSDWVLTEGKTSLGGVIKALDAAFKQHNVIRQGEPKVIQAALVADYRVGTYSMKAFVYSVDGGFKIDLISAEDPGLNKALNASRRGQPKALPLKSAVKRASEIMERALKKIKSKGSVSPGNEFYKMEASITGGMGKMSWPPTFSKNRNTIGDMARKKARWVEKRNPPEATIEISKNRYLGWSNVKRKELQTRLASFYKYTQDMGWERVHGAPIKGIGESLEHLESLHSF